MTRYGGIRLGDSHTGGGTMLEASGFPVNGINLCVIGDRGYCPTHNGTFPLVSTGNPFGFTLNGRRAAYEPAKVACGCSVISSCRDFFAWVDEGGAGKVATALSEVAEGGARVVSAAATGPLRASNDAANHAYDRTFVITNDKTGMPLPNTRYRLTLENGQVVEGETDEQGMTERVSASERQNVKIEVFV